MPCSEYLWSSPGVDRVNAQNLAVIQDIVTRYPVDGVHFDRVRYPGRQYSVDPETLAKVGAAVPPVSLADWQRNNLSAWVARYTAAAKRVNPDVTMSAAVWFTYKKTAAMTFPTSQGYYDYFQDSHRWLQEGALDALAPMIYGTTFNSDITKWQVLADDHVAVQGNRQVWLGIGAAITPFDGIAQRIAYAAAHRRGRGRALVGRRAGHQRLLGRLEGRSIQQRGCAAVMWPGVRDHLEQLRTYAAHPRSAANHTNLTNAGRMDFVEFEQFVAKV